MQSLAQALMCLQYEHGVRLLAFIKKAQEEARFIFAYIGAGLIQVSCLVKYFS